MISLVNSLVLLSLSTLGSAIPVELESREALANSRHVCTVQKSPNPGDYCNFRGKLSKPAAAISTITGAALTECRNACLESSTCKSYGYTSNSQVCKLYKVTIDSQNPSGNNPNGPISYSNKACFTATYYKDVAVVNPGFESGNREPWYPEFIPKSPNSLAKVVQGGNNSQYALELSVNNMAAAAGKPDLKAYFIQDIDVCEGIQYKFYYSFYVVPGSFAENGECSPYVAVFLTGPSGFYDFNRFYTLSAGVEGSWYSYEFPFSPTTSGAYKVRIQANACAKSSVAVKWDDIQLQDSPQP